MFKNMLEHLRKIDGNAVVAIEENNSITYSELLVEAKNFALRLGEGRKLVLLECEPTISWLISYVGVLLGNHIGLLIPPDNKKVRSYMLDSFKPNVLITLKDGVQIDILESNIINLHDDLCLLLSTSGSTGSPKCVRLSHKNLDSNASSICEYLSIDASEVGVVNLPTHYSYGLSIVNSHLRAGATLVFNSRSIIENEFWDFCKRVRATSFAGVPHSYDLLSRVSYEDLIPPSIKYFTQAGGKLSADKVVQFAEYAKSRDAKFFVMYGQTEAAPRMSYLPSEQAITNPDSIGVPIPGGAFKIVDEDGIEVPDGVEGELVFIGPNVMMGYAYSQSELSKPHELNELKTGDLAKTSQSGLFYITGRLSRFIKVFGNRISLDQVEAICRSENYEVIVTGIDEKLLVVTRQESSEIEIKQLLMEVLKLPHSSIEIRHVTEFPTLSSGKFDYNGLKQSLIVQKNKVKNPENKSIRDVFLAVFGKSAKNENLTFIDLGGDSLTFVTTSIELEGVVESLPNNWAQLTIEQLDKLPKKNEVAKRDSAKSFSKLGNVDTLRAIACILVVAFHVFGSDSSYGLKFAENSNFRVIFDALDLLRMPLFTALAGVLFVAMVPTQKDILKILKNRVLTLLLPAMVVSLIYFTIRTLVGKESGGVLESLVSGYLHFWYLYSLFLIVFVIGVIHVFLNPSPYFYAALGIALHIMSLTVVDINILGVRGAFELAPYFILGILMFQNSNAIPNQKTILILSAIALIGVVIKCFSFYGFIDRQFTLTYLALITSCSLILVCYYTVPQLKKLEWIGIYSYAIYLWHPLISSTTRTLGLYLGIENRMIHFTIGLIVAVLAPIIIYKIAHRLPLIIRQSLVGR